MHFCCILFLLNVIIEKCYCKIRHQTILWPVQKMAKSAFLLSECMSMSICLIEMYTSQVVTIATFPAIHNSQVNLIEMLQIWRHNHLHIWIQFVCMAIFSIRKQLQLRTIKDGANNLYSKFMCSCTVYYCIFCPHNAAQ